MSAWIEVEVKGGHRAVLAADAVVGVIVPKGGDADTVATPDAPLTLVLRGGETLPPVFDISAAELILRAATATWVAKQRRQVAMIVRHDPVEVNKLWDSADECQKALERQLER